MYAHLMFDRMRARYEVCKGPWIFNSCSEDEDLKPITTWAKKDSTKIAEENRYSNL
jgi:hypothetical protein